MKSLTETFVDREIVKDIVTRHRQKFELYPMIKTAIRVMANTRYENVLIGISIFGVKARPSSIPFTLARYPGFSSTEIVRTVYCGRGEERVKMRKIPLITARVEDSFPMRDRVLFHVNPAFIQAQILLRRF